MDDMGSPTKKSDEPRKIYNCDTNHKTNDDRGYFERKDEETKPYPCNKCHLQFKCKYALEMHSTVHSDARSFLCVYCMTSFKHRSSLVRHMKEHLSSKDEEEKPYPCDECHLRFTFKSYLEIHLRSHSDSRLFKCEHCEKSYKHRCHLVKHKNKHHPF